MVSPSLAVQLDVADVGGADPACHYAINTTSRARPYGSSVNRRLHVVDVFAGCGGMTQGFVDAGFIPVAAVDHDPVAGATYAANFGPHARIEDADEFARRSFPRVDVVDGGPPPCQGFSTLGLRNDRDPRNRLVQALMEVVRKTRPAFFVIENVPLFLGSSSHRSLVEATNVGGVLAQYGLRSAVVNAADYGTCQPRWGS